CPSPTLGRLSRRWTVGACLDCPVPRYAHGPWRRLQSIATSRSVSSPSTINVIAPIHCLPNEILSLIFASAWDDQDSFRLAHVCRHWRQVLLSTPEFWADAVEDASYPVSRAYLAAILERSRPLPIQPAFFYFTIVLSRTLDSELWRITALRVDAETTDEVTWLHCTLRQGMPVLAELVVVYEPGECRCRCDRYYDPCDDCRERCHDKHFELGVEPLPAHAVPHLRHIEIPAFLFPKVTVPSLRRVRLDRHLSENYHENPQTNLEDLLLALVECPEIVQLVLVTLLMQEEQIDDDEVLRLLSEAHTSHQKSQYSCRISSSRRSLASMFAITVAPETGRTISGTA
ncbi:hypothetical protein C8T65DRAFT_758455, partial [Cerioporus squamosus]